MVRKKPCDSTNTESPLRLEDVMGFAKHIWFVENFQLSFSFSFSFSFFFLKKKEEKEEEEKGKII